MLPSTRIFYKQINNRKPISLHSWVNYTTQIKLLELLNSYASVLNIFNFPEFYLLGPTSAIIKPFLLSLFTLLCDLVTLSWRP